MNEIKCASTLAEAFKFLKKKDDNWKIMAGGTDLMVLLERGLLPDVKFLSIFGMKELQGIKKLKDKVIIGAGVTFREIATSELIQNEFPLLASAASQIGAIAIQNRATIGGNIANASPAADSTPALIVYDAFIEIRSDKKSRMIPLCEFFTGYKQFDLAKDEILVAIHLPIPRGNSKEYYRKVGPRKAMAISKVVFAAKATIDKSIVCDIRLALGSVAPITKRLLLVEDVMRGKVVTDELINEAIKTLNDEINPISDIRSTDLYRKKVAENLVKEFLKSLIRQR